MAATLNSIASPPKLLHIDALQSVLPGRVAEPGQSRRIAIPSDLCAEALQSHFRMVLYYKQQDNQDQESAWKLAAWMKESLSAALPDFPVLCGRLRRASGEDEGDGCLEIKFNDSGVRLVQATADVTMAEFLSSEKKDEMEGHLAYWENIDEKNPNFSALFFIQVTQFHGGGYSIGISCSLFLADPLFLTRFLKSWAQSHIDMAAQGRLSNPPIFHLGYFQRSKNVTRLKSIKLESTSVVTSTTTVLVKLTETPSLSSYIALASRHVQESIRSLEYKYSSSHFLLMVNVHSGELRVESSLVGESVIDTGSFNVAHWDELGMHDLVLEEGNKTVQVSFSMVHPTKGGLVVLMIPCDGEGTPEVYMSVTVPR